MSPATSEAIAYGHDNGHPPGGHEGERFLTRVSGRPFRHNVFGVVIAQKIERQGRGLNLARQTLEGIQFHSRGSGDLVPSNLCAEADAVMYADKIGYVFADFNDLFFRNVREDSRWRLEDFPELAQEMAWFGPNQGERMDTCIAALCQESAETGRVSFAESEAAQRFARVMKLMYEVYPLINKDTGLETRLQLAYEAVAAAVPDIDPVLLFALLNDRDVSWLSAKTLNGRVLRSDLARLSIAEVIPHLQGRQIDFADPDMDW